MSSRLPTQASKRIVGDTNKSRERKMAMCVPTFVRIGSVIGFSLATMGNIAHALQTVVGPAPANTGLAAQNSIACAASANGTAHLICVSGDSNNNLSAVSLLTQKAGFPASPLDPVTHNPLPLGAVGTLGISSCASTADTSGDVVCAYTSTSGATKGQLLGIRFNIFSGTVDPIMNLGVSINGAASCTNASPRFTVTGPPAHELPIGATICGARRAGNNLLLGIAFNPATKFLISISANEFATTDPSCTNANDGSTHGVTCVYNNSGSMRSIAFNTNLDATPFGFASNEQNIYPGTVFAANDSPSCSAPNDGSGDVLCAVVDNGSFLAFAVNPITNFRSMLQTVSLSSAFGQDIGAPSCSGIGDNSFEIICSVTEQITFSGIPAFLVPFGLKFDPRSGVIANNDVEAGVGPNTFNSVSCTFENVNPAQIACGVLSGTVFGQIFNP